MTDYERRGEMADEIRRIGEEFSEDDAATLKDDVKAVLATAQGRRVLMAILTLNGVFGTIGERGEHTTQAMIEVGRHNLAQDILAMANANDPDGVLLATKEHNELVNERNARIEEIRKRYEVK